MTDPSNSSTYDVVEAMRAKRWEAYDSGDWTNGEKIILRWQYRELSGFYTALIDALGKADSNNRSRLRGAFPALVDAFIAWKHGDLAGRLRDAGLMD